MTRRELALFLVLGFSALGCWLGALAGAPQGDLPRQRRHPVALVLTEDGKHLFVANRRGGSVTAIDTATLRTVGEVKVGRKLADLAATLDGRHLLAVDEEADELIVLARRGTALEPERRVKVGPSPVSVSVSPDGAQYFVASMWARQITVVILDEGSPVTRVIPLPFAPRQQLVAPETHHLIVADAFGGRLGVVDYVRGQLLVMDTVRGAPGDVHKLPAHNIRGLALSRDGKRLLVTHQILNDLARTSFDDVHWGNLLTNNLRELPLADLVPGQLWQKLAAEALAEAQLPKRDLLHNSRLHYLGDVGRAAGDPACVAVVPDGRVLVALAGVGEVALGPDRKGDWQRLAVGRRPTAVVVSGDGKRAYVANTFDDSISVLDLKEFKEIVKVSLGPQPDLSIAERGELLFHDAKLTHDGWFSCHSCHTDGHSNGQFNDNFGDNSWGAPKRVLSLLGARDSGPWAWNGQMPDLEMQIRKSLHLTMRSDRFEEEDVKALAAYVRTLPPPPPAAKPDAAAVARGRAVFEKNDCASCHAPPAYTSRKTYDVGLRDEAGNTAFNPPSLRGVGQGGPYFHDGRAATLEEVVMRFRHQLKDELTAREREDLLTFLRSL